MIFSKNQMEKFLCKYFDFYKDNQSYFDTLGEKYYLEFQKVMSDALLEVQAQLSEDSAYSIDGWNQPNEE